jgi:hypothetical protein
MKKTLSFILILFAFQSVCYAQKLSIQSVQFGYRMYEMGQGFTPYTISEFVKEPEAYNEMISQYETDGYSAGGGILVPKHYYFNVELGNKESKFWSKYSLQTGISIGSRLSNKTALSNLRVNYADQSYVQEYYFFTQNQRFVGVNLGLRRRIGLSKSFNFLVGLETEARFSVEHNYTQQKQSIFSSSINEGGITYENLRSFEGKQIIQGHIMLPIGFEFVHKSISLRAEGFFGLLDDRFRSTYGYYEHAGLSFWLGYRF